MKPIPRALSSRPGKPSASVTTRITTNFNTAVRSPRAANLSTAQCLRAPGPSIEEERLRRAQEEAADRDFLATVLSSKATKRDTRQYFKQFTQPRKPSASVQQAKGEAPHTHGHKQGRLDKLGVNLGSLYGPSKAIEASPIFSRQPRSDTFVEELLETVHVAVVKLRAPQSLDDETLKGIGLTLGQLGRLGLRSAVIVDCDEDESSDFPQQYTPSRRDTILQQAARVAAQIDVHPRAKARVLDSLIGVSPLQGQVACRAAVRGGVEVDNRKLLHSTLSKGIIAVLPPLAFFTETMSTKVVSADDVVLALTRDLAGINPNAAPKDNHVDMTDSERREGFRDHISLDKIIILDTLGGMPANNKRDNAHIFVNLEQEYRDIRRQLSDPTSERVKAPVTASKSARKKTVFGLSNPFSKFVEDEVLPANDRDTSANSSTSISTQPTSRHVKNLDLAQQALTLLPPSSSALITTPSEAANSAFSSTSTGASPGVATRRQKNPLIHNLLTDKPLISSSLPTARLASTPSVNPRFTPSTVLKRGMPLTIIPDPHTNPWTPPGPEGTSLLLDDPRIDFPRLLNLIEDSFQRPLDVRHYLSRIRNKIAGVIIAGEYEGGAILTWETPSPSPSTSASSPDETSDHSRRPPVPYLDKFAVLQRSQGAGGVADIVFNAMVRTCFPDGVVWRSRSDNPVNKWYFERSTGTWRIPRSNWTMFWTGRGVEVGKEEGREGLEWDVDVRGDVGEGRRRWRDYVRVCEGIEASWKNREKAPD
ncbi:hypothetical protein LTS18_009285 [Coniosporium uncinatum]|uniref:Uncharacterized protein n=1 Tax=Coniosporium uncinatum TaxID=93489 RepID=A0ACC3DCY5_9PEZI|nr:hypothetical protein LTS18_009285 [Coniosporium uncinatum]